MQTAVLSQHLLIAQPEGPSPTKYHIALFHVKAGLLWSSHLEEFPTELWSYSSSSEKMRSRSASLAAVKQETVAQPVLVNFHRHLQEMMGIFRNDDDFYCDDN